MIIHPVVLFREGLRRILNEANFRSVWCSDRAPGDALPALRNEASPLLIIGTEVGDANVHITEVKRLYPTCRIVLLLDPASPHELVAALRCGTDTVLSKHSSCDALIRTLEFVLDGAAILPCDMLNSLVQGRAAPSTVNCHEMPSIDDAGLGPGILPQQDALDLSARELNVLLRLRDGLANKEIARALGITEATVKVHVKAILRKTRTRNRTEVAMWASRRGLGQASEFTPPC